MNHKSAQRADGRTPANVGWRQRLRSKRAPVSRPNNRCARIVQADGNLQETRRQQEEGDKDARPPVLTASSLARASTQSRKVRCGKRPVLLRHCENVEGESARQSHHELIQLREVQQGVASVVLINTE